PCQMLGARHQLLALHTGELAERSIRRLVPPDALGRGIHWIATVAVFVVAVVLVAMDHDLVADLPAPHLVAHGPDDTGSVGTGDVVGLSVPVDGADRHAARGPYAIVVHPRRHHQNQHVIAVQHRHVDHLLQHRLVRVAVAFATDRPGVHLL